MYFGTIFLLIFIVPLFVIPVGLAKKRSPYRVILTAMITTSIMVIVALAAGQQDGMTLGEQFLAQIEKAAKLVAESEELSAQAGLGNMTVNERIRTIVNIYAMASSTLPSAIIVISTAYSFILYKTMTYVRKKRRKEVREFVPLKYFRWPVHTLFGFFAMFLLAWALESVPAFAGTNISMNMNLILEYVVALEGVCTVLLMISRFKVPKILNAVLIAFGLFSSPGRMIFFGVGLFEFFFGLGRMFPTGRK